MLALPTSLKTLLQTRRVFVAVLVLGLFTLAARSAADPDVWWHLKTGKLILQNHSFFHTDPYSFTRSGQPWINHEWLSQVLLFGLYRVAGLGGLLVAFAAIIAATLMLVFLRCPGRPYLAGLMTLWGSLASASSWGVRPQIFSLLLAGIFLIVLDASERHPNVLWWTPPLMLLWVNLHAGYPIGLGFLILFLLGEALDAWTHAGQWIQSLPRLKRLGLVFAVCVAVVPLNPNGVRIYGYPFETLRSPAMQRFIQEWSSPDFHDPSYAPFLLMLLAVLAALALSPQRLRIRDIVLLLATIPAALVSVRHIPILILVLTPILTGLVDAWVEHRGNIRLIPTRPAKLTTHTVLVNALVLVSFACFALARVRHVVSLQREVEAQKFPRTAASFLDQERPPGPILNHYNWGGYLIWKLYPRYRVFVDGRADVYGDRFMDALGASYYLSDNWKRSIEQWGIRTVILPPDAPLVTGLRSGSAWQPVYADSQAVILIRRP